MFEAPSIISGIPDIAKIYSINENQEEELDKSLEVLDGDIFLMNMSLSSVKRWEAILNITLLDDDTEDDRRFRIRSKIVEKVPYTYSVILRKLSALCPDGFIISIDEKIQKVFIKISLSSARMKADMEKFLEEVLPLNIVFGVDFYNRYGFFEDKTYEEMGQYTYERLRDIDWKEDGNG